MHKVRSRTLLPQPVNKKNVPSTVSFKPSELYKSEYSFDGPHCLPIDYICGVEDAGQSPQYHEKFFQFVYGKESKNAHHYYLKHRLANDYLKKNHLKKIATHYVQLTVSIAPLPLSAEICREMFSQEPRTLGLNYHVRCVVNFAGSVLGLPNLSWPELIQRHQNDDFRGTARRLLDDTANIHEELLSSKLFGILAHWGLQAWMLLNSEQELSEKQTKQAVLCWHALAYLYNSRAMVQAGRGFPTCHDISYLDCVVHTEHQDSQYDQFYEQHQNDKLLAALTQTEEPLAETTTDNDIPRRIVNVSTYFLNSTLSEDEESAPQESNIQSSQCQQPQKNLDKLKELFSDQQHTDALSKWAELMTPDHIAHQRSTITESAFTLVPALLARISEAVEDVANQFEITDVSLPLPQGLTAEALSKIDYNRLYLATHDILPRLQHPSSALNELEEMVTAITQLALQYCDHQLEPGQMPPPSVIRALGSISLEIGEQMARLTEQWPELAENILAEHNSALQLLQENREHSEAKADADYRKREERENQLIHLKAELRDIKDALHQSNRERDRLKRVNIGLQSSNHSNHSAPEICFKDITQLLKQKVSYLDILNFADTLYGDRLQVLESARQSAKDLGTSTNHLTTMARQLQLLVDEYLPAILSGQPDSTARKCFSTNVYCAKESETVSVDSAMAAQRTFVYNNEERFFEQHLRVGKTIRIHFLLDKDNNCVVIGHCGMHLRNQMTANQ